MKSITITLLLSPILITMSCVNTEQMLTRINSDGSCYREFERGADSAFMVGDTAKRNPFPVDLDSTWKISWQYNTPEIHREWPMETWTWDTTYKYVRIDLINGNRTLPNKRITIWARRNYKSVEEMASMFRLEKSNKWHALKVNYSLNKKFRWFYTYFLYKEIYPKIKTFDRIPLDKYMTNEEAGFWFNGNPDLLKGMNGIEMKEFIREIEKKFNRWFAYNLWDIEYEILINNYEYVKDVKINKERLVLAKDSIFNKNYGKVEDSYNILDNNNMDLGKSLDSYFNTDVFSTFFNQKDNPMNKKIDNIFDDSLSFANYFEQEMSYNLLLPGKILHAKNAVLHNDTLVWKITAYRMVKSDFEICAQSRKPNYWAFVLTGIIILGAVGIFFIKTK
jgi:hypothetical protein